MLLVLGLVLGASTATAFGTQTPDRKNPGRDGITVSPGDFVPQDVAELIVPSDYVALEEIVEDEEGLRSGAADEGSALQDDVAKAPSTREQDGVDGAGPGSVPDAPDAPAVEAEPQEYVRDEATSNPDAPLDRAQDVDASQAIGEIDLPLGIPVKHREVTGMANLSRDGDASHATAGDAAALARRSPTMHWSPRAPIAGLAAPALAGSPGSPSGVQPHEAAPRPSAPSRWSGMNLASYPEGVDASQGVAIAVAVAGGGLLLLLAALYSLIQRKEILGNKVRREVLRIIEATPGLTIAAVAQQIGVRHQTACYHVEMLRKAGLVAELRRGNRRFLFVNGGGVQEEERLLASLAHDATALRIMDFIRQTPNVMQNDISALIGRTRTAGVWHVQKLMQAGLVRENRARGRRFLEVVPEAYQRLQAKIAKGQPEEAQAST